MSRSERREHVQAGKQWLVSWWESVACFSFSIVHVSVGWKVFKVNENFATSFGNPARLCQRWLHRFCMFFSVAQHMTCGVFLDTELWSGTSWTDSFRNVRILCTVKETPVTLVRGSSQESFWLCACFFVLKGLNYPEQKVVTVGQFRIGLCHGHQIVPWGDVESLGSLQRQLDVDVLITGHTHHFENYSRDGKLFLNPGTATGAWTGLKTYVVHRSNAEKLDARVWAHFMQSGLRRSLPLTLQP